MAELLPFSLFQNGGRRHLGFLQCVNFDGKSVCGTPFSLSLCFKFGANACNSGRVMAKNVIFNMAAAAMLDCVGFEF